ncbi:MAG: helix-turn-helix domain-containing protein [Gammaproteobacteria bacterium]
MALSDPVRCAILQCLSECDDRVSELAAPFDISLAAISRHRDGLEHVGLFG